MSFEHRHDIFEEKRAERVDNLKAELKLESLPISNVSYYQTIEQQNQFLNNIKNTHFGQSLVRLQHRFNVEMGIPLILPRFNNITNISVNEQRFLAMQGLRIGKDRQGNYGIEISGLERAYETIEQTNGKAGAYYQKGGAGYQEVVKQKKPARVFGVTPEPTVVTGQLPFVTKKPPSVFKAEPKITTVSKAPIEILPMAAAEPEPKPLPTKCYMVHGKKLELTQDAINYYKNIGVKIEECKIDLDFDGVSTPVTTQGGEEILITEPTEPAQLPAQALPIGFTGIIAGLIVLGGLLSWGDHKRRNK